MLSNEKILISGPTSQVAFPLARELAQHNEVFGLARFSKPEDRERLEAVGVQCLQADLAESSLDEVPEEKLLQPHDLVLPYEELPYNLRTLSELHRFFSDLFSYLSPIQIEIFEAVFLTR